MSEPANAAYGLWRAYGCDTSNPRNKTIYQLVYPGLARPLAGLLKNHPEQEAAEEAPVLYIYVGSSKGLQQQPGKQKRAKSGGVRLTNRTT